MKKFFAILAILCMLICTVLPGCGTDGPEPTNGQPTSPVGSETDTGNGAQEDPNPAPTEAATRPEEEIPSTSPDNPGTDATEPSSDGAGEEEPPTEPSKPSDSIELPIIPV